MGIFVWWMAVSAHAEEPLDRLSASMGLTSFAAAGPSGGALGTGYLSVRFLPMLYLDLGGRTGLLLGPLREVTGVNLGMRLHAGDHVFFRAGLVHQHETDWEVFAADPVGALVGSGDGIGHRSGIDGGIGYRWTLPAVTTSGVHVGLAALATWLPDDDGPPVYGTLETLLTIDLGKPAG